MSMTVPVIDATAFLASFKALEQKLHDYLHATWIDVIKRAEQRMYQHGYQNRTGRLTSSMKWAAGDRRAFGFWGTITIAAKYAVYVDRGTKPHDIHGNPLLKFYWPKIGAWVALRKVKHPGTMGAGFSEHARQYVNVLGPKAMQAAVDEIARRE